MVILPGDKLRSLEVSDIDIITITQVDYTGDGTLEYRGNWTPHFRRSSHASLDIPPLWLRQGWEWF